MQSATPNAAISRQARWQRKRIAAGLCSICGKPRVGKDASSARCGRCIRKERARHRKVAA